MTTATPSPAPLVAILDDEPQIRLMLTDALADAGFRTASFSRATEFEAALPSLMPAICLVDLGLPDKDGLALVHRLALESGAAIIIISGRAQVQDKVQARQKLMTGTPAPVGSGPQFVDLDGDGIPDGGAALGASRGTHRGRGMMKANVGSGNGQRGANVAAQQGARGARNGGQGGAGFVDANGDGVCDNGGAATSGGAGGISGGNGSGGAGGNGSGNGR